MPRRNQATAVTPHRDMLMWALLLALLIGQLIAFWMLCSDQMRKAELRNAGVQVERTALADCLVQVSQSNFHSCLTRVSAKSANPSNAAANPSYDGAATLPSAKGVMPVSFAFR